MSVKQAFAPPAHGMAQPVVASGARRGAVGGVRPLKILFSEGSSTSARQSLYALGRLGHVIDVCDSQRFGVGRFSRYVRRWYLAPSFAADPAGYLDFLGRRLAAERYDVLLPTHDQVFLLSRFQSEFAAVGLAVPPFESVRPLQNKLALARLLERLKLPQPAYRIVECADDLSHPWQYPVFVKQPHGTAGRGVWRVESDAMMERLVEQFRTRGDAAGPLLVQQQACGEYRVLQAVFQRGTLVSAHSYAARAAGVGGSAHARIGLAGGELLDDIGRLGSQLAWHGALHVEYFYDATKRRNDIIEINPRIGETMNATASGVNLCQSLVQVSLDQLLTAEPLVQAGVRTHSIVTSLLGAAERGAMRRQLLRELWQACRRQGVYHDSEDELVRPAEDLLSCLPAVWIAARLLVNPRAARHIVRSAVERYSLDEQGVQRIETLRRGGVDGAE